MLKVTNRQLATIASPPNNALGLLESIELRGQAPLVFRISKLTRRIRDAMAVYEQARQRLVEQHTTADGDAPPGMRAVADMAALTADAEALLAIEVEIDGEPIPFSQLSQTTSALTAGALADLDWLISE